MIDLYDEDGNMVEYDHDLPEMCELQWCGDRRQICGDCGELREVHPDSDVQRGEPICHTCVAGGAFAP